MIFHILLITILRLIQNDLSGKGILSLSTDLLNVTWAYFFFQPNSTSLEIQVCILLSGENEMKKYCLVGLNAFMVVYVEMAYNKSIIRTNSCSYYANLHFAYLK